MTIRDHMNPEVGGLGRKIETPKPPPEPVPIGNGIVRDPDGRLRTEIPENERANSIPWAPPVVPKLLDVASGNLANPNAPAGIIEVPSRGATQLVGCATNNEQIKAGDEVRVTLWPDGRLTVTAHRPQQAPDPTAWPFPTAADRAAASPHPPAGQFGDEEA